MLLNPFRMSLSSALLRCQTSLQDPLAPRLLPPPLHRHLRVSSAVKVRRARAAPALTLRRRGQTDWQSCRNRFVLQCLHNFYYVICYICSSGFNSHICLSFSLQLKAVHEQLTALSQGPIVKPKKKKEKKDKKKKKKVEKEKHRKIEEEVTPVRPPKTPKITKTPKPKTNRGTPGPVVPVKKAPSKKNNKSK